MILHVATFGGGVVVEGSADSQRTDEVQLADGYDIGARGQLVVTSDATDYLLLKDNGVPSPWTRLWALLECAGLNFSKVVAIGEGIDVGTNRYLMTSFNREGEASPFLWASGGTLFALAEVKQPLLDPLASGAIVTGADFSGVFPVRFTTPGAPPAGGTVQIRLYLVNVGAREGVAPNLAPGLYIIAVVPPVTTPFLINIGRFDALGTGSSGLFTVPSDFREGEGQANGGSNARQLFFRGIIGYNNHVFGWGYAASDERIAYVTAITNANPGAVTTSAAHGFSTGDTVLFKGVGGMTQLNGVSVTITVTGPTTFTIGVDTTLYGVFTANGLAIVGNGDGAARVMFSNLGRPLKWGNDNIAPVGTDRKFTDDDAIVLGDAGEIIRGAITWAGKLIFGTNKGLHYVAGYGRDTFVSDGATPIMRSYNVVGAHAMIEGPDKKLYGVAEQGLWVMPSLEADPVSLFQQLRDFAGRSNGYWDQMWTENTAVAAGAFVVGRVYTITTVGTTNFVAIGAASNTVGVSFTATGVGAGTGTATPTANSYPGQTNLDLVWMAVDWERQQVLIGIPWCSVANGYGYGTDTVLVKYHVQTGGFTRQQFIGVQYTAAGYFRSQAQQAATRMLGTATSGKTTVQRYGYKATNNATPALPTRLPDAKIGPYSPLGPDGRGTVRRLYLVLSWDANGALPLAWTCTLTIDGRTAQALGAGLVSTFALTIAATAPTTPQEGDLWLDTGGLDPNLGNVGAGAFTIARGGYLLRVRRDNFAVSITGATRANPCVVTAPAHGFATGQRVSIRDVAGMVQLNNDAGAGPYTKDYTATVIDADHFSIGVDSTAFGVYTSGGQAALAWTLVPGLGMKGTRASIPIPVVRIPGTRYSLELAATTLTCRYQIESFGMSPGDGDADA